MVTLYVIEGTENKKRYVGITCDLEERLKKHGSGTTKAGIMLGEFTLIHTETFENYKEARIREKYEKTKQQRLTEENTFNFETDQFHERDKIM